MAHRSYITRTTVMSLFKYKVDSEVGIDRRMNPSRGRVKHEAFQGARMRKVERSRGNADALGLKQRRRETERPSSLREGRAL